MPTPTRNDMHQSRPLQNFTLQNANEDDAFIGIKMPFIETDHRKDSYYIFDTGNFNRPEMERRGSAEESAGGSFSLSTDSFSCDRYSVHKDYDMSDVSDADEAVAEVDQDAAKWLASQWRLHLDGLISSNIFAAATWDVDVDGVSSGAAAGTSVLHWSDSSSTPQKDHLYLADSVETNSLHKPNTMVVGSTVHQQLLTNPVVRAAIQYTGETMPGRVAGKLADFFDVENYFVARAGYNSAKEGLTTSMAKVINSKDVWCGYIDYNMSRRSYSAMKIFAFKDGGRASKGIVTRKFELPTRTAWRYEIDAFFDVKVTAAAGGYFIDGAVA